MSFPPPIPVEPLSYATEAVDTRRPAAVVAIGVMSIVFSVTFGLSALFSLMMVFGSSLSVPATGPGAANVTNVSSYPNGIGSVSRQLVIDRVESLRPLTPTRRDVLAGFLAQEGQTVLPSLRSIDNPQRVANWISVVRVNELGHDVIDFSSGKLTLEDTRAAFEPTGSTDVLVVDFAGAEAMPGSGAFVADVPLAAYNNAVPARPIKIGSRSLALMASTAALNGILAAVLLIAGILTIRSRPAGRTVHLWWAWLKILLCVVGGLSAYFFWYELINSTASGQPNTATTNAAAALMIAITPTVVGLLYPVAVLITMHARSVRNYLASMA